ncbi:hypothetical protein [Runella slithyformis]|nr:hypothetical protein [Runella slithyformis]
MLLRYIDNLPEGYSEGLYQRAKYGITKTTFTHGRSFNIYAKE